jgi:LuxR family transcriptional regulator, maltose regulon positive regulatory protein
MKGLTIWGECGGMGDGDVRQQDGRSLRVGTPVPTLVVPKVRSPLLRPGTVRRSSLIGRLGWAAPSPVVSVVAPAGYGKTTLLAQWAEASEQAFAWVPMEEPDNDPKVLLTYIAEALDAVEPIAGHVFEALASPGSSVPGSVVPRLASAFWSMSSPVVLVLDDVHVLRNSEGRSALSLLADHVPADSRLVLAGRTEPPVRIARLRAEGRLMEIGAGELSLTREEAAALLRNAGLTLSEDEVEELYRRTEGWPAGLYLAALCLKDGGSLGRAVASFAGDDRFVSEYVESEFFSRISSQERVFLTRTAVLDRMCGPLCETVSGLAGSAATLADVARSNLLLVPLDRRGEWYRYHHLFRDILLAELHRAEPSLVPVLRRRAANWYLANDLTEQALEYFIAAGDTDAAAGLAGLLMVPAYQQGRVATVQRWLRWLEDRGGIAGHPLVAVLAGIVSALTARPVEADRWADVVDRWQHGAAARPEDPPAEAWAAVLRAMLCRHGVGRMGADADEAVGRFAELGIVAPVPSLLQGLARVLSGDLDGADVSFQDGVSIGELVGAPEVLPVALSERALVAMARREWDRSEVLAGRARAALRSAGSEQTFATPLVCAVHARVAMHQGDTAATRRELVSAQRLRPLLTHALPHLAVQARIELIRVHLALADLPGARTLMREIDEILRRRPGLGILADEAGTLRARLAAERGPVAAGASALTAAELRLLPLLATHLSFPEIGGELFLSRNTIKSQAHSIYRKLSASTRSQTVARARELGLLEG